MEQVAERKIFFNVFPTLKVEEDIQILFADVEVQKITTNSSRDFLHVHIFSRHLIQKKQIWLMEQRIEEQLFPGTHINVKIIEKYALSGQYTPAALLREYRDSMILELKETSVLAASMFSHAEIRPGEDGIICLELLDTIVSEGRREEILHYMDEVFCQRFQMDVSFNISYRENDESGSREYDEQRLQEEINSIFERSGYSRKNRTEDGKTAGEAEEAESAKGKAPSRSVPSGGKGVSHSRALSGAGRGGRKKEFKKKDYYRPVKTGDDPNLIYGRNFDDETMPMEQIVSEMGEVTVHGKIISFETREIRNEKTIIMFSVTDFTDTITVKMFTRNDQLPEIVGELKKGAFVKIKGITTIDKFDGELTIGSVTGIKKIGDFTVPRKDLSPVKRVELHCHTKMSDMDGVSEVNDIVKRAHDWGHPAIAITDHGAAQAFRLPIITLKHWTKTIPLRSYTEWKDM